MRSAFALAVALVPCLACSAILGFEELRAGEAAAALPGAPGASAGVDGGAGEPAPSTHDASAPDVDVEEPAPECNEAPCECCTGRLRCGRLSVDGEKCCTVPVDGGPPMACFYL